MIHPSSLCSVTPILTHKKFKTSQAALRRFIPPLLQLTESTGCFSGRDFWDMIGQTSPGSFPALPPLFNHPSPKQTLLTGMMGQQRLSSVFVLSVIHWPKFRGKYPELKHNFTPLTCFTLNFLGTLLPWHSTGFLSAFISQTINKRNEDHPNHSVIQWQLQSPYLLIYWPNPFSFQGGEPKAAIDAYPSVRGMKQSSRNFACCNTPWLGVVQHL